MHSLSTILPQCYYTAMEAYLDPAHYDLVSPDGLITEFNLIDASTAEALVFIQKISPNFVGFTIEPELVTFNIKSTVAQLGLDGVGIEYNLDAANRCAEVKVRFHAIGPLAKQLLKLIGNGAYIGKLFAADPRRRVRNPEYLSRMFGRSDRKGRPLLSLGGMHGSDDLILEKVDGRTVAYLTLQPGRVVYDPQIEGLIPTIARALHHGKNVRELLSLHQHADAHQPRNVSEDELLLVRTLPLHIRTVFARVIGDLLTTGYQHTSADVLQPDTTASGDIYELFGSSRRELTDIPLEFYTLEPYREHVFFRDRDQLQECLENADSLFKAFKTAPEPKNLRAATFIVKGEQLLNLKAENWIARETRFHDFPGLIQGTRQAAMVERYIEQQPSYPFLQAISNGLITSQGVMLSRYFPSPLMKRFLLGDQVQRSLKGIYFQYPSSTHEGFFSAEDRAMLHDLEKFAIPVYWVDNVTGKILQFTSKPDRDSGMFVPLDRVDAFYDATLFGVYGSNLIEGNFEEELVALMEGVLEMRQRMKHPKLKPGTPLALVTGGGPGAMAVGNRVARNLDILSCANIVDFGNKASKVVNEQHQNPYVDAKMTYRLDKLVERQAEFNLDFPIFVPGGIGTDFEYCLEEVRRKVGAVDATPILLFGEPDHWSAKITPRFQANRKAGTIKGSEWISNSFFQVQSAEEGIAIYEAYFAGTLPIGKDGPIYEKGFVEVRKDFINGHKSL